MEIIEKKKNILQKYRDFEILMDDFSLEELKKIFIKFLINDLDTEKLKIFFNRKDFNVNFGKQVCLGDINPLLYCAYNNQTEKVKFLLENNADVNYESIEKITAVSLAILNKNDDVLKLLIERGGKLTSIETIFPLLKKEISDYYNDKIDNRYLTSTIILPQPEPKKKNSFLAIMIFSILFFMIIPKMMTHH